MTSLNVARVAKLIALFGFFLPWVLVSCAGEPIGRLSGVDLATGLTITDANSARLASLPPHPNLWVTLALAAVVGGLVASFLARGRQAFVAMAVAAVVALVASAIGLASVVTGARAEVQSAQHRSAALGSVNLQYGYMITVAGLLATLAVCGMTLASGRVAGPDGAQRRLPDPKRRLPDH